MAITHVTLADGSIAVVWQASTLKSVTINDPEYGFGRNFLRLASKIYMHGFLTQLQVSLYLMD